MKLIRPMLFCAAILAAFMPLCVSAMTFRVVEYGAKSDGHGQVLANQLDPRNTPSTLAVTNDGAIWFRETFAWHPRIARFSIDGSFREYPDPYTSQEISNFCFVAYAPAQCLPLEFQNSFLPLVANGNAIVVGPIILNPLHVTTISPEGKVGSKDARGCLAAGPDIACFPKSKVKIQFSDILVYSQFGVTPKQVKVASPNSAVLGPDGNIWFTDQEHSLIGRVRPSGRYDLFTKGLTRWNSGPQFITVGSDGNLWFTEQRDRIGTITKDGKITEYSGGIPAKSSIGGIVNGPDGALWFTLYHGMVLGRRTLDGNVQLFHNLVYPSDGHDFDPVSMIVRDMQGRLYYNEGQAGRIARVTIIP